MVSWDESGFEVAIDDEDATVMEPDESTIVIERADEVVLMESVVIGLRPTTDGGMEQCRERALEVTIEDDSAVLRGTTYATDGSWWEETYDTASDTMTRTFASAAGVTTTSGWRRGPLEVGERYVTMRQELLMVRDDNGQWHGALDAEGKALLQVLDQRHGLDDQLTTRAMME